MIRKICEFSLSLNDVHRPDWASTTMPADLVDVSVLSQDGRLRLGSSSSVSQKALLLLFSIRFMIALVV
jgi:hypothetical protein